MQDEGEVSDVFQTAQYYDTIYLAMKDYGAEAEKLTAFIHQYCSSTGHRLLDVACGTGLISPTQTRFQVEGLDLDEQLLAIARQRKPDVPALRGHDRLQSRTDI
jgi:predicted TPR repeat methyltransferase